MIFVMCDVIILANTKEQHHFDLTKNCIESLRKSEDSVKFNIIVVESNKNSRYSYYEFANETIVPPVDFNYNLFINIGLRNCKSDFVCISNNDVLYSPGWYTALQVEFNKDPELMSVSPIDRSWHRHSEEIFSNAQSIHIGQRTSYEFTGWCFVFRREMLSKFGSFDERFAFYYQDNDICELYERLNIKHGLVTTSHIKHLLSKSHDTVTNSQHTDMNSQHAIFNNKYNTHQLVYKRLSVLILTMDGREQYLQRLLDRLKPQLTNEVEILMSKDNKEYTVGKKRNSLLHAATGEYVCFIDDDDWVSSNYISTILQATDYKPDVVGFNSLIIFNGDLPRRVEITSRHKTWNHQEGVIEGQVHPIVYHRCPNHLSPVKKSIAMKILFPEINDQEDRYFSLSMLGQITNEVYVDQYLYFYDCRPGKKDTIDQEAIDSRIKNEFGYVQLAESYINENKNHVRC